MVIPHGYDQIVQTYGDPSTYRQADGHLSQMWEFKYLTTIGLPAPLPYAYGTGVEITKIRCHKAVANDLQIILAKIKAQGLWHALGPFGGCFVDRGQRGDPHKLSTHTWGIALDFNPAVLKRGVLCKLPEVEAAFGVFEDHGWRWGNHFSVPDPMHVQAATGY